MAKKAAKKVAPTLPDKPAALGYRMPAEWEPQDAIWIAWPYYPDTWGEYLSDTEKAYAQWVQIMHRGQKVCILVKDAPQEQYIKNKLQALNVEFAQINFYRIKYIDTWMRDYGPTFVVNPSAKAPLAMVKWTFDAWGGKYDDLAKDNRVPRAMNEFLHLPMFEPGIQLEGGSIDVNGAGCVLTTEQCLLNENRNPHLKRAEIEQYLKDYLNITKVLWLKEGIAGDDTDGHIDDIARFVNPTTVVCAMEEDTSDVNYDPLKENYETLQRMTDQQGNAFRVVKIPMPGPVETKQGVRLPASYTNFYIGNQVVAVPVFDHPNDAKALQILQDLFPTRTVVGIPCRSVVYGLGTLHCCSQQQPRPIT